MKRIGYLFKKEMIQLKRDKRSLVFFIVMPTLMLILFGYALSTDIKHLPTAVYDKDGRYLSRELIATMQNSDYFDIKYQVFSEEEVRTLLDNGSVKVGMIIPDSFSRDCRSGNGAQVQVLIDGSQPQIASTALNTSTACIQSLSQRITNGMQTQNIEAEPRVWYNPAMRSANFMVPGLIGLILQMLIPMMTVVGIVRERETGTIEQLITTPIKPYELILGKLLPYMTIAFFIVLIVSVVGSLVFQVPIKGSLLIFGLVVFLFLLVCLSIGLLFSTIAQNQLQAFQMVIMVGFPSILLSGITYPRVAMPKIAYYFGNMLPLTHFIDLIMGVTLKGVGLKDMWGSFLTLICFEIVIVLVSIKKFKKKLG